MASVARRARAAQSANRASVKQATPANARSPAEALLSGVLGRETAGLPADASWEDSTDVIKYGDTVRLQSLADSGFLFAEGYKLNDVMWRPTQNLDKQSGNSEYSPTIAAQFTIVCKHTYDKAKQLKKTLSKMGVESVHDIHAKQAEEDVDASLVQAAYELQGPVRREKRHNLAEVSRSVGGDVRYGSSIQLRHTSTGKFVTLDTKRCGCETGSLAVALDKDGSEHSWLTVTPAYRVRKNGDRVQVNDQVKLVFESRSEEEQIPVHLRATPGTDKRNEVAPGLDAFEVCGHDGYTRWRISQFAGVMDAAESGRLLSGMSLRMTHKEEDAYLSCGQMSGERTEAYMVSKELVPSCGSSPRTLWTVVQTDVTSSTLSSLDRRPRSELRDLEVGGGIIWGNLCFIQNLVGGSFLQVVGNELTAVQSSSAAEIDLRSILFEYVPVNDKKGEKYVRLEDLFYIKHPDTGQWLHVSQDKRTAQLERSEHVIPDGFSDDAPEPNMSSSRLHEGRLRLTLKGSQPDEDAFGVESCAPLEVEDYQEIASTVPLFADFVNHAKAANQALEVGADGRSASATARRLPPAEIAELGLRIERKLGDLITGFITTKTLDPNPVTSRGVIHSTRRQDLLREAGLMQLLCEMCEWLVGAKNDRSVFGNQLRTNVLLGNVLLKHAVRGHDENRRFLVDNGHIQKFKALIDADLHVTDLLTEIYSDNDELLRQPNFPQHLDDWLAKLRESIRSDGHSASLYLRFLASTCCCNGHAVRPNQVKVLQLLFDEDMGCVMQLSLSEVDGELLVQSFDGTSNESIQKLFLEESSPSRVDEIVLPGLKLGTPPAAWGAGPSPRQSGSPELKSLKYMRAMRNFVIESMGLFTALCADRHEAAVTRIRQLYPRHLLSNVVQTQRLGCELLRAQAMELFIVMYVDYAPFVNTPTVAYTREWNKVKQHDSSISEVLPFEKEIEPINNWVLEFLKENSEQVKELMGLNKLVLACTKFVRAALRVGYYNTVHELEPQLLALIRILDGRTDREVPEEASTEAHPSAAVTDGWFRPWNQDEVATLAHGVASAPIDCYDTESHGLNKRGWEWLSNRVSKARSGVVRSPQMCANRWHERVAGAWRYEETEETVVLTQTKGIICQILNLACEVRLNARLTHVLALFIEPLEKIGASVPTAHVAPSRLMVTVSTDQGVREFDTDDLPLPGQTNWDTEFSRSQTSAPVRERSLQETHAEDLWPRILGDKPSRRSEERWKDTHVNYYHVVVASYPVIFTWEQACQTHTEIRDAMNLLRFQELTGTDYFAGCKRGVLKRIENGVNGTLQGAERATHIDLDTDGDAGVKAMKKSKRVSFDDILLDLLMYSDTTVTAEAAKLLINVHNERQELALALQKVQLLKHPASIAFADKAVKQYQKELKAFFVSNREKDAEKSVITVLKNMCVELTEATSREIRLAKQRLFDNLGIDDDVVAIVKTGRLTAKDVASPDGSRWNLYQEAYNFLRQMCVDNGEIKEKLSHYMPTYFVHIEVAGLIPLNAEALIHEIYDGNLQLAQQITSEQIRFYCRLMSRPDMEQHDNYPNLLPRHVKFLCNIICVNDVIVKRNQLHVLNALKLHQFPMLRLYDRFTWEHGNPRTNLKSGVDMMSSGESKDKSGGMAFHIAIVTLLHNCCLGENKPAETLCSQLIGQQDAAYIICHEKTLIPVKTAYVMFVDEVYIKTEAAKRNIHNEEWCWQILNNILVDMEMFYEMPAHGESDDQLCKDLCDYAVQAVFPFVEYWFQHVVKTKDTKLNPQYETIKVKLFKAIRLLGPPPRHLLKDGATWPLQHVHGNRAEIARAELVNKRCCRAIQSTLNEQQEREAMRTKSELQDMSLLLPATPSPRNLQASFGATSWDSTVDVMQRRKSTSAVMSEEEFYQRKLSNEFAKDFTRLCSAQGPLLYTFLDPDKQINVEMNETLHEEMLGLAKHLQGILVHEHSPLSAGRRTNVHRNLFIQNLANELTNSDCDQKTKIGIIKMLQLTVCMTDRRTDKGRYVSWPHGERTSVLEQLQAEEAPPLSQLQRIFCTPVRDADHGINLPAIIVHLIGSTTRETDLVREAFNLAIVLLTGGNQTMQEAFLEEFSHGYGGEACLERMQELLFEGKLEVKESQKHYKREREMALRGVNKRRNPVLQAKSVPTVHLIRAFKSTICVRQVLCLLHMLCEGGNRRFQDYLSVQAGAQNSVDLVQASLMYMQKWQECLHPEIMSIGCDVFGAITEFVVGPNSANQGSIGDAIKLDGINKILGFEVTDRAAMATEEASAAEVHKIISKQVIEVKSACIDFLCALIEGARSSDQNRTLQKLKNLDTVGLLHYIQTTYREKALWQEKENEFGLDFGLGLVGDFVPEKLVRTVSDGLAKVSEKSGIGMLTSDDAATDEDDEFERTEREDALAFNYFVLLRQLHDNCERDPKTPTDFVATTVKLWEENQTETARETKKTPWFAHKQNQFGDFAKGLGSLTKDMKGVVESVRNLNAKTLANAGIGTVKSAGLAGLRVSTKALDSLHQVSKRSIGGLGTIAKGLTHLSISDELNITLHGALLEYMRQCGRIEILRADSDGDGVTTRRLQRVYFRIPEYCYMLSDVTREDLRWKLSALTPEQKLQQFVAAADDCEGEMRWQNKLDKIKLYQILNKRTIQANGDAKQRLDTWKNITNWLAYLINLLIVLGYEHEDKYWSVPEPWTQWRIQAFGTEVNLGSWSMVHSEVHPYRDKVNYVPTVFYNAISLMGLFQIITCGIIWFIFVLGHGPLVVRTAWKQQYQANTKAKQQQLRASPGLSAAQSGFKEHYAKLRRELSPRFVLKSIFYLFHHPLMCYYCAYLLFAVMGVFHSQFWFAFHLLDILQSDQTLQPVIQAVLAPISQIAKTLLLAVIVMYMFTVIAFIIFHNNFDHGTDIDQNMCNSMLQCLIFTVYSGIIDATSWAEMTVHEMWPGRHYRTDFNKHEQTMLVWSIRVVYDIMFFLLIGVLLIGGVLFGIILDKFTELREERRNGAERLNTEDFISGLSREILDGQGNGFVYHQERDQNMWHYMYLPWSTLVASLSASHSLSASRSLSLCACIIRGAGTLSSTCRTGR